MDTHEDEYKDEMYVTRIRFVSHSQPDLFAFSLFALRLFALRLFAIMLVPVERFTNGYDHSRT